MKNIIQKSLLTLGIFSVSASMASIHELGGSAEGALSFSKYRSQETRAASVRLDYDYLVSSQIQFGLTPGYSVVDFSSSKPQHNLSLYVGPTFNFSENIEEAFFLRVQGGFHYYRMGSFDDTHWGALAQLGKRFRLTDSVSFKPYVGYAYLDLDSHASHTWSIVPLSLSVHFD